MAWVFVQGMVRWHHRHDLLKRFPVGWPEYKKNVPEWWPRWRPWVPVNARLVLGARDDVLARVLERATGLDIIQGGGVTVYKPATGSRRFYGVEARLFALTHVNLAVAIIAHAGLIVVLAAKYLWRVPANPKVGRA